jgi:hypothetical protein
MAVFCEHDNEPSTSINCGETYLSAVQEVFCSMEKVKLVNYVNYYICKGEQGSSVSIVSDYGPGDRGSIPGKDKGFFL